ncbi:hypothetical protein QTP86_001178 [Hemibagrus guttatus]|nr:hypothetical protein QTP86_001178 [Hemibagrus guttatus]
MDESIRLTFLFDVKAQDFIKLFSECHPRMLQFLSDLDEAADQLDKMKLGSDISSVAGSSVGITGGVLSIAGLALAPFTAGASLALTLTGVGLGVTSGVNSLVTGITEMAVNNHHGKNANNVFSRFMEDVQQILDYMEDVGKLAEAEEEISIVTVDGASGGVNANTVNMGLQETNAGRSIPKLAADLPDIRQLVKGTSLALSKSARAGLVAVNALFIGLDVFFICKDSISLSKGSKNEVAQFIRSRSVLWRSEVNSVDQAKNTSACLTKTPFEDLLFHRDVTYIPTFRHEEREIGWYPVQGDPSSDVPSPWGLQALCVG